MSELTIIVFQKKIIVLKTSIFLQRNTTFFAKPQKTSPIICIFQKKAVPLGAICGIGSFLTKSHPHTKYEFFTKPVKNTVKINLELI